MHWTTLGRMKQHIRRIKIFFDRAPNEVRTMKIILHNVHVDFSSFGDSIFQIRPS